MEYFHCPKNPLCSAYLSLPATPLPHRPLATTDLFYCLHSFALSRVSYNCNHTVCSLFRLASFTEYNTPLRFLHIFSWLDSSFLFSTQYCSIVWMYHSLLVHSPAEGHLGRFQILAIMNKAAINICVQVFVWICFQLLCIHTKVHDFWIIW